MVLEIALAAFEFVKETVVFVDIESVKLVPFVAKLVTVVTTTLETTICRLVVVQVKLVAVTTKPRLDMFRIKLVEGIPESVPLAALKVSPFRPASPVRLLLTTGLVKLASKRTMLLLKVLEFV